MTGNTRSGFFTGLGTEWRVQTSRPCKVLFVLPTPCMPTPEADRFCSQHDCFHFLRCTAVQLHKVSRQLCLPRPKPSSSKCQRGFPFHGSWDRNFAFRFVIFALNRLCGLVVLGYRSGGPGSIPGTTRKKSSGSGTGSTQPREYN
jgi:hypothetical protein